MSVRLFCCIFKLGERYCLLTVLVVEENIEIIIVDVNAVYKSINNPLFMLLIVGFNLSELHNPFLDFLGSEK